MRIHISIALDFERETLRIMDDRKAIAHLETKTVDGHQEIIPVTTIRYQYDNHLGSACLELDENAAIITYEEYHPFGTTSYRSGRTETEVSLKRYKYVGKERDEETGLYYYGARYYAAWMARFVSVDPLQHKYPHYTPYQYAGNKPITFIDLDGLEEVKKEDELIEITKPKNVDAVSGPDLSNEKYKLTDDGTDTKFDSSFFTEININDPHILEGEHIKIHGDLKFGPHTREGMRVLGFGTTYKVGFQQEVGSFEILFNGEERILNLNLYNKDIEFQAEGSYLLFKGGVKTFIPQTNVNPKLENNETDIYGDKYKLGLSFAEINVDENATANLRFELFEANKTLFSTPIGNLSGSFSISIENVDLQGFSNTISESGYGLGSSYQQRQAYLRIRENEIKSHKQSYLNKFLKE